MTTFRFLCSHCQSKLAADFHLRAEPCGCPKCGKTLIPEACTPRDIRFVCPECRTDLLVDQRAEGNEISCPHCTSRVKVPGEKAASEPLFDPAAVRLSEQEIDFLTA